MEKNIVVIKGDGVGPEVVGKAIDVLNRISEKYSHKFNLEYVDMGGCSIDKYGVPLTDENVEKCIKSDAVLLGSVGGPKWDKVDPEKRPERGLLRLRKEMKLYANIRPTKILKSLEYASPLKETICKDVIDFIMVVNGIRQATDLMLYTETEIRRIGKVAFELARNLKRPLTSVDKANVLHTSKLWREVMNDLAKEYSDVEYNDMYVDNAAMQIASNPSQFGVIVTENMFGDILSDEASVISGSIGMAPSASLSDGNLGLYEPIHGSAPDIAGNDLANPIGTILSLAMMFRYSFGMNDEADDIDNAVIRAIDEGYRTRDIMPKHNMMTYLYKEVKCSEMGDIIVSNI